MGYYHTVPSAHRGRAWHALLGVISLRFCVLASLRQNELTVMLRYLCRFNVSKPREPGVTFRSPWNRPLKRRERRGPEPFLLLPKNFVPLGGAAVPSVPFRISEFCEVVL